MQYTNDINKIFHGNDGNINEIKTHKRREKTKNLATQIDFFLIKHVLKRNLLFCFEGTPSQRRRRP